MAGPVANRILCLDQFSHMGGGQRFLLDVIGELLGRRLPVVAALPGDGSVALRLRDLGVPVLPYALPDMAAHRKSSRDGVAYAASLFSATRQLLNYIVKYDVGVIHVNGPRCLLPALMAATIRGVPVITSVHLIFDGGKEFKLLRWCYGRKAVRAVTFGSRLMAQPFKELEPKKKHIISNWASREFFEAPLQRAAFRAAHGWPDDAVVVGVLGRIARAKGQRLFVEAVLPLLSKHPKLIAVVGGSSDHEDPGEEQSLRDMAAAHVTHGRIIFTGTVSNAAAFYDGMDAVVIPSLWAEPFGLVAVEAMARGKAVVCTRSGALVEIVEDEVTGLHADPTAGSLRAGVHRLVENSGLRVRLGDAGLLRAKAQFDGAISRGRIADLIAGCLAARTPAVSQQADSAAAFPSGFGAVQSPAERSL